MADIIEPIGSTADDVITFSESNGLSTAGAYVGGFLVCGRYNYANTKINVGLRFPALAIDQGQQIDLAEIKVYQHDYTGNGVATWFGHDVDDAPAWASTTNLPRNITRTSASASVVAGTNGTVVAQDVTAIVQEILDRGGWTSGNDMAFLASVSTATGTGNRGFFWHDFSTPGGTPAVLEVTFTAAGGSGGAMPLVDGGLVN